MKRVLALEHVWDDPLGYLGEILQMHHIPYDVINVEEEAIPDPGGYGAVVVMGGPQHAYEEEKHPYLTHERVFLQQVVAQDVPFLGVCLGAQMLVRALHGTVKRHTMTEMGFFKVHMTEAGKHDPLFRGLPGYQEAIHWHEDVFDLPAGAVQLATNENTENQAFRYGRHTYGVQYHIELTPGMLTTWLRFPEYQEEIIKLLGPEAPDILERDRERFYPIYHEHTCIMFENFLRIAGYDV